MKSILLAASLGLFIAASAPAAAQSSQQFQDTLIGQLTDQGFTRIRVSNTMLGRVRIVASSPRATREIIFNPRTGEILRDYWDEEDDDDSPRISPFSDAASDDDGSSSSSSSGSGSDDREDDREEETDDDDKDQDDDKDDNDNDDDDDKDDD